VRAFLARFVGGPWDGMIRMVTDDPRPITNGHDWLSGRPEQYHPRPFLVGLTVAEAIEETVFVYASSPEKAKEVHLPSVLHRRTWRGDPNQRFAFGVEPADDDAEVDEL
jgi:hypothetical protein